MPRRPPPEPNILVRRLCSHDLDLPHQGCPGPGVSRMTDSDLAAAFYDILTEQEPRIPTDLAGPKVRALLEHIFTTT